MKATAMAGKMVQLRKLLGLFCLAAQLTSASAATAQESERRTDRRSTGSGCRLRRTQPA